MKATLVFLLKLCLTIACLWWALSKVGFTALPHWRDIDFRWIAGGIAFGGVSILLHALRWWFFLRGLEMKVSYGRAAELILIDGLFNLASVSGLGGDAARIVLLSREHPGNKLPVAMSVMIDHLAGLVGIALWFFAVSAARFTEIAAAGGLGEKVVHFTWVYLGGGLVLVALMFVCASPPVHRKIHANDRFSRWPLLRRMPEICDQYRRRWPSALAGLACSFALLAVYSLSFYCGLRAVGGAAAVAEILSAMPVIDALSAMPVSVSGIGVRERLFQILMGGLAGVSPEKAVAASLAGFACNAVWAVCGALFFLRKRDRLTRRELAASQPG